jgi:hypothetical protein
VQYYFNAITLGKQQIKPPGPPDQVARQLAAAEAARLRLGDLWYFDDDLCALLTAAHATMPPFAPSPPDLPSKVGFAIFATPIALYPATESQPHDSTDPRFLPGDPIADRIYQGDTPIVAATWGPLDNPYWPAHGLWMSFYATSAIHFEQVLDDPAAARRARAMIPRIVVDNEAVMAWRPNGAAPDRYRLPGGDAPVTTLTWARLLFAAFQLAAQFNLSEQESHHPPRAERRRTAQLGLPERDLRIVRLRRSIKSEEAPGTDWRHRWIVRGHWRKQWYPSMQDHRPLWIAPHVKGPAGAPLLGGDKVNKAGPPVDNDNPDT